MTASLVRYSSFVIIAVTQPTSFGPSTHPPERKSSRRRKPQTIRVLPEFTTERDFVCFG
ncbi:hypothetical protein Hdeb2414_s0005g00168881 [Helianthus debilis subsp. tardiflorus]